MNITLEAKPSDAPCCVKIIADDGRDVLIQTDWDYPSIASNFGWSTHFIQACPDCGQILNVPNDCKHAACHGCNDKVFRCCDHSDTDGTIACKCGLTASHFITSARQFIDDNDGAEAEDPGYFEETEK